MPYSTRLTYYLNMYLRYLSEGNIKKTDLYRKRVELLLNNPPKQIKIKYTDADNNE
jgi:hypothetical protein